ncbi:MAG: hypothetical protein R8G34_12130 [Paracoccaceae bacterium]|nr:hypothetical protein [Paracoccaceae bacterium]
MAQYSPANSKSVLCISWGKKRSCIQYLLKLRSRMDNYSFQERLRPFSNHQAQNLTIVSRSGSKRWRKAITLAYCASMLEARRLEALVRGQQAGQRKTCYPTFVAYLHNHIRAKKMTVTYESQHPVRPAGGFLRNAREMAIPGRPDIRYRKSSGHVDHAYARPTA